MEYNEKAEQMKREDYISRESARLEGERLQREKQARIEKPMKLNQNPSKKLSPFSSLSCFKIIIGLLASSGSSSISLFISEFL